MFTAVSVLTLHLTELVYLRASLPFLIIRKEDSLASSLYERRKYLNLFFLSVSNLLCFAVTFNNKPIKEKEKTNIKKMYKKKKKKREISFPIIFITYQFIRLSVVIRPSAIVSN